MNSRISQMVLALCALVVFLPASAAQRTFVSTDGVNNPGCSLVAPCRDFAAAITATSIGGEVIVLNSGGYGSVTITKAVSIIAPPGVYAGISVFPATDGVTVAAGPTDKVVLRGLTINGQGGWRGISITSAKEVYVEDCTVANNGQAGIYITGNVTVHMKRITARNNEHGTLIESLGTSISVTMVDSSLTGNASAGLVAITQTGGSTINASIARVTALGNIGPGFVGNTFNVGAVTMAVADSTSAENGQAGVQSSGSNATVIVSGSSLVNNSWADLLQSASGVLRTAGNNALTGRGAADVVGTLTSNPLK